MPISNSPQVAPIPTASPLPCYEIRTFSRRGCRSETPPGRRRPAKRVTHGALAGRHAGCIGNGGGMTHETNTEANEFAPGTILQGTYRIAGPLAEGGCGEIYLADHTRLPGRVAIKVLHRGLQHNAEVLSRFRQEAEITATLRHPQIAQALSAAHARGIVHRDLKPDNIILLSCDGMQDFVKILDFGISQASWRPRLTNDAEVAGTPQYMAPEQAQGLRDAIEPRTDQFSLAAIAYTLLTGQEPFVAE